MLADVPMVFILVGIAAYTVLSGADFGAGLWTLVPGGGQAGAAATRDHTRHAIGPVWEANHVWLIFVLTVAWTCYPGAFGSIVSTLAIPLLIAAIGIIFRGTAYALRSQFSRDEEHGVRLVEYLFALSSVLTPFALATVIGAIATGRVPVGNARGDLVTSWLNPVSVLAGVLAVAFSGYLAAVYLAADAQRLTERTLVHDFRIRALASGVVAGALALAGLLVIRVSARPLWDGLTSGLGLVLVDRQRAGRGGDDGAGVCRAVRAGPGVGGARGGGGHRGLGRGAVAAAAARPDRGRGRGGAVDADRDHRRGGGGCGGAGAVAGRAVLAGAAGAPGYCGGLGCRLPVRPGAPPGFARDPGAGRAARSRRPAWATLAVRRAADRGGSRFAWTAVRRCGVSTTHGCWSCGAPGPRERRRAIVGLGRRP